MNSEETQTAFRMDKDLFKNKVVIVLSEELGDGDSRSIRIQNYYENGELFIPIFTSTSKFSESSKGMIKNPTIQIDGYLFLSILKGDENIRVNPALNDDRRYKASELIKIHSEEIKDYISKLNADCTKSEKK
jgi:hypothetical protein